jgi:CRISPR type IV-associated protein Csf3
VQKVDTATGNFKNYDLPLFIRLIAEIHWFAVGEADKIKDLLNNCKAIGKKRSLGNGQVAAWNVRSITENFSLQKETDLMRPVPRKWVERERFTGYSMLLWGYKPPARMPINQTLCLMPLTNVA